MGLLSGLNLAVKYFTKSKSIQKACKSVGDNVPLPKPKKTLFCHEYWGDALEEGLVKNNGVKNSVSLHGEVHGINHHFIDSPYPEHMDMPFMNTHLTPREMISETDFDFKSLKPLEEKIISFRCIGEKPTFFKEYSLYKKRLDVKKGDIIDMKEYAYSTSDISYARVYLPNNRGILYEIEYPAGSRVSVTGYGNKNEVVAPRASKYECTDVEKIVNDNEDYLKVKLKYILPDEPWRNKT